MRFTLDPEMEAFRQEVRQVIHQELPADWVGAIRANVEMTKEQEQAAERFQQAMADRGWLTMAWPSEHGGEESSHWKQTVLNEELSYRRAPTAGMEFMWVAPSLMLYGTDDQKQTFLPMIKNLDAKWCTLYSEPGAGSDLASLQTRAVEDGDEFVLNGQRIWTSGGHLADWGWLAARTDTDAPKHKGISMFLLDMKSPGITVRPLINMADDHSFNEVFFEDVRIPKENLVGEKNRGWYHLAVALDFERSGISGMAGHRRTLDDLIQFVHDHPHYIAERPTSRYELADRYVEAQVGTNLSYRITSMQAAGLVPNYEASIAKLFGSEMGQRIASTAVKLIGMEGQYLPGNGDRAPQDGAYGKAYLGFVSATIGGGTSEVQRNIIATRGLGLPRG